MLIKYRCIVAILYKETIVKRSILIDEDTFRGLLDEVKKLRQDVSRLLSEKHPEQPKEKIIFTKSLTEIQKEALEKHRLDPFIRISEAAELLGVSSSAVRLWIRKKYIKRLNTEGFGLEVSGNELAELKKNPPEWLRKAYRNGRDRKRAYQDGYISTIQACGILKISRSCACVHVRKGNIASEPGNCLERKFRLDYIQDLKENPPEWLKRSWKLNGTNEE